MAMIRQFSLSHAEEDVKLIDKTGRRILDEVGVKIGDGGFLDLLEDAGARVDHEAQRARFDGDWLDEMVGKAPGKFVLHSRDGKHDVRLGEGTVHFSNGGRVFRILDMGTGGYRRTMLRDVAHTAALVDELNNIDLYIIACQAHDLSAQDYHLNDFYNALNHTFKHVMGGCDHVTGVQQVWDLVTLIAGGEQQFRDKPFVSVITNPISPLTLEGKTLGILQFCCHHGIPATCAPAPMAGATGPATLAGTLAQMHAEALAGVAIAQVFCPAAKILYGAVPTSMDLRTMDFCMGAAEMAMMNSMAVRLAKLYDLPIYSSAGVTESKRPDVQAGVEKSFSILTTAMAGADLVHLAAGMLDSGNSISYEQYVIDNEIIGMSRRLLAGITIDEDSMAFDVIKKVGPGGNYVTEDHTIDHMMDEFLYPDLAIRSNFDIWEEQGRPSMLTRANDRVEQILEKRVDGLLEPDVILAIEKAFPGLQSI